MRRHCTRFLPRRVPRRLIFRRRVTYTIIHTRCHGSTHSPTITPTPIRPTAPLLLPFPWILKMHRAESGNVQPSLTVLEREQAEVVAVAAAGSPIPMSSSPPSNDGGPVARRGGQQEWRLIVRRVTLGSRNRARSQKGANLWKFSRQPPCGPSPLAPLYELARRMNITQLNKLWPQPTSMRRLLKRDEPC